LLQSSSVSAGSDPEAPLRFATAENGLDSETWVEENGFDILCLPPFEAVEPSNVRIACCSPHDVICRDDEILSCDHDDSNEHYKAFMKNMDEFVRIFQYCNEREQNLLAWSIVGILRRRGGRFLVCDDRGQGFFEGGDSNALRVVLSLLNKKVERFELEQARTEATDARKRKRTALV
jgi:hypothetical protein